jgi:hypothetical protein
MHPFPAEAVQIGQVNLLILGDIRAIAPIVDGRAGGCQPIGGESCEILQIDNAVHVDIGAQDGGRGSDD